MNKSVKNIVSTSKRAFTLIELLIVVLIIGILASVALPQYQKAVEKSRAAEAMTVLNAIYKAEMVNQLEKGSFTDDLTSLSIGVVKED